MVAIVPQAITKAGYSQPTAIQAQALPAALSGRDVLVSAQRARQAECAWLPAWQQLSTSAQAVQAMRMASASTRPTTSRTTGIQVAHNCRLAAPHQAQGIAKTGSGKTAAFVLPMLVHIMDQPELQVRVYSW